MDTVLIPRHSHELSEAFNHGGLNCAACDDTNPFGYSCDECKFSIHKKCVFPFYMEETFEHPSHVGHRLKLLTTGAPDHTHPKCHLCGKKTKRLLYHCSTCKLNLDIDCMLATMCAKAHLVLPWHPHPLLIIDFKDFMGCEVCCRSQRRGYFCPLCRLAVHRKCLSVFKTQEIAHPSHVRHPLKLLSDGAPSYTDRKCHLCGKYMESLLYHCDKCKFNLDMSCALTWSPPIALSDLKVHEHTLTLMPKLISFVCDACGTKGDRTPYVCVQCDFMMFHQDCTDLPRVNHHDHRVSYKYPLGPGEWKCGVCWEEIDWSYGAYSCSICPNYALHSKCATRDDVWDGEELDGVPEKDEDIESFMRNDDNTITHFTHEHNLSLNKDGTALEESILCVLCVRPIGSDIFYNCSVCSFSLHETCAYLPRRKRHFLSIMPLQLGLDESVPEMIISCYACQQCCCNEGFMRVSGSKKVDIFCSSIPVPFTHGSHPHPLLYFNQYVHPYLRKTCQSCGSDAKGDVMGCLKCNYFLDFRCATLPLTVRLHRYDDHPLTLCYGEKARGKYWCDICERETNPKFWFYTCIDCGVTFHVLCVLGDIIYAKAGGRVGAHAELLSNNRSSRPLCNNCHSRCPSPFILKSYQGDIIFCSFYCFVQTQTKRNFKTPNGMSEVELICPPWALKPST